MATPKRNSRPAHGAARLEDVPQGADGSELHGQSFGQADGLANDYASIHDTEELTMHRMHEGDSDAPLHPGWNLNFMSRTNLEAPPPRAGYEQRWIRCEFRDGHDHLNLQKQYRQGWQPRDPATIPEHDRMYPVMKHSSGADCIYVGGMMLCERPIQIGNRARAMVRATVQRYKAAVSEALQSENAKNMRRGLPPIRMEEHREIETGKRRPKLQDD